MVEFTASVCVEDILDALDMEGLPTGSKFTAGSYVDISVEIDQSCVDEAASAPGEPEPELIPVDENDLRDGLAALLSGDRPLASTLLIRALNGHETAQGIVEQALRA